GARCIDCTRRRQREGAGMMSTLPLLEIAAELQAVVRSSVPVADLAIANVCTDSRALRGGDLSVALRGERFDGHDFIAQVADRGAVAAVVSAPHESKSEEHTSEL